ncbi:Phospholipase D family protein [Dioscorea alata]|uniref:Phospholipase D family protein n=1 Tax=Dioscorea alata TaxID=55571 RepID=A0ACB7UV46_DIOAL|nr:Phospholipase D family protein [Dioscorea alata]
MDNYGNPYPYPYPFTGAPPPPPMNSDPHQPPPHYLHPSNSFPANPPPSASLSGHFYYPPPQHSPYDYYNPYPPSAYVPAPAPSPYYPSPSAPPDAPALEHSSSSSSLYPIDSVLADMRISESTTPSSPSTSQHHGPVYPALAAGSSPSESQHMQIVPFNKQHSIASLKVLLLHGSLDIWIFDAFNLPNLDMFSKTIGDMLGKRLTSTLSGKLEHMSSMTSDPYVSIVASNAVLGRTYVISNSENPVWTQHFCVPVAHHAAEIEFVVKDNDVVGSQIIGTVAIPVEWIYSGEKVEGTYPILGSNGKPCKPNAVLRLSIQYIPIHKLSMYHQGVGPGPEYGGVPGTYFPLRKGGKVTLYQDAHVPDGSLPDLRLGHGEHYQHGKCWRDICDAISQARRLVYIVGWSVLHTVCLVRDAGRSDSTLGDLLKSKSQEGVRVLILVWDDPTSRSILGFKMDGVMQTHDEETRRFFKHSSVQVLLCPRSAGKRHSWVKQQETATIYTHHQKTVIVDADAGYNKRKIVAFVGGLDLCDGRYDTPQHFLFSTLQTLHKNDYHNPTFTGPDTSGPREPWHDLHSKIDGPAAYDVLTNFEERWLKASKRHGIRKLKRSFDDALLKIERIHDIIGINDAQYLNDDHPESWHVQVFRSIDSNSVKGFPKDPKVATSKNLVCGKNVLIDMSIHTAYVKAIRSAQHFIYIENQYFLGSSYNWDTNKDLGANNLVPIEIALKIANKIKANERFSAYIVIPMWPEGIPTSTPTQRILFWQNKTMQMMYEIIYKALKEVGLEDQYEPQDYLNFFCLGNREAPDLSNPSSGGPAAVNTPNIYGYRMSLWAEHIGFLEECFTQPETLECMRRVRALGEQNWKQFTAAEVTEMRGHLLKYPVDVDRKGKVKPLPGCETFPDVGGNICGTFLAIQENLTI